MSIRPIPYFIISFLISAVCCFAFVLSAVELYSDDDYVHKYLGCPPEADSGIIAVMGAIMVSLFWFVIHVIAHIVFIRIARSRMKQQPFEIALGFNKGHKTWAWIVKIALYAFALFLVYSYMTSFYRFYAFEFFSYFTMIITVLMYGVTISNLIERSARPEALH